MSLDRANAFYRALYSNQELRQAYKRVCSDIPSLPYLEENPETLRRWREDKILQFAESQGYCFGLGDLYKVWFGQEDYRCERESAPGWRMRAIAALNRQIGKPIIPRNLQADAVG